MSQMSSQTPSGTLLPFLPSVQPLDVFLFLLRPCSRFYRPRSLPVHKSSSRTNDGGFLFPPHQLRPSIFVRRNVSFFLTYCFSEECLNLHFFFAYSRFFSFALRFLIIFLLLSLSLLIILFFSFLTEITGPKTQDPIRYQWRQFPSPMFLASFLSLVLLFFFPRTPQQFWA